MPWSLPKRCWRPQPLRLNSWPKSLRERCAPASRLMTRGQQSEVERALREEVMVISERLDSPETKEALSAFLEKRKPDFSRFPIVPDCATKPFANRLIMEVLQAREMPAVRIPCLTPALGRITYVVIGFVDGVARRIR